MNYDEPEFDPNPYAHPSEVGRGQYRNPPQRMPEGASTILICGILSLVICAPLGIAAWMMGNTYMAQCHRLRVQPDGVATAGRICGIVGSVLFGLQMLVFAIWLLLVVGLAVAN